MYKNKPTLGKLNLSLKAMLAINFSHLRLSKQKAKINDLKALPDLLTAQPWENTLNLIVDGVTVLNDKTNES